MFAGNNRYLFFVGFDLSAMMSQKPWQRAIVNKRVTVVCYFKYEI